MKIKIANRLRPFSHLPGTYLLLPGTTLRLQVFPTKILVNDLSRSNQELIQEIDLPIEGPVSGFTVQLDLERGIVQCFGNEKKGFFRFYIIYENSQVQLKTKVQKETAVLERLSFGCHKKQDWELVHKRQNMAEILPFWFQLAQWIPEIEPIEHITDASLIDLYKTLFYGMLVPRTYDEQFQGIEIPFKESPPLAILHAGARLIKGMFLESKENEIDILSHLPPEFHAGRMTNIQIGSLGSIDLEWTKKFIRRLIFRSNYSGTVQFNFKNVSDFRLNGKKSTLASFDVETKQTYFFDNFT